MIVEPTRARGKGAAQDVVSNGAFGAAIPIPDVLRSLAPNNTPLRGGAHVDLVAPDTITFVLYAPHKPYVSLVGDFNGWNTRAHPLSTDGQGLWWTTLPHPGKSLYGYYVAVDADSHVWVGDPYARSVRWHKDGAWAHVPQRGQFAWTDQNWRTPPLRDLVIYELCVRDFGGRWESDRSVLGRFRDLLPRIDHLRSLGVNAVEIMPVNAFPGESSWGYNPVFYFAPAASYGPADDLRRFVNECHAAGIAVILDVAFNHAWGEHPWYRIYPPMYGPKGEWLEDWNPFFHQTPAAVNAWGGVDWDHFSGATTPYFQDVVRYWLHEFHIDGFRFDWVCGVDYDSRDAMNPGFNPYHGIAAVAWAARQAKPDCILIGEFWQLDGTHPDKSAAKLTAETELDAVWNGDFHHVMEEVLTQRWQWEQKDIFHALGGFRALGFGSAAQVINYTCSHDEVRPEHEIRYYTGRWMERPPGMSVQQLALAMARLGLVALFAAPGVPMIYSGQEYGENSARTIDFVPLQWGLLDQPANRRHYELVQRLIRARRSHPALRSDEIAFGENHFATDKLVRFWRWDNAGDAAAVALNFSPQRRTVELHLPFGGRWLDVVTGTQRTLDQGAHTFTLEPFSGLLLVPTATA